MRDNSRSRNPNSYPGVFTHRLSFLFAIVLAATTWVSPAEADLDVPAVRTMLENRQFERAMAVLEPEVKSNRNNHEALYYLGYAHLGVGDADGAISYIKKAIDIEAGVSRYHYWLSQSYGLKLASAGKFSQMRLASKYRKELEQTLELDPHHLQARLNLVEYCLQAPGIVGGGMDKAYHHARIAVEKNGEQGRLLLAQVYQADEKIEAAEAEYRELEHSFGDDPTFAGFFNTYGYFLMAQGRHDEAVTKFQRLVQLVPDSANAHDSLGDGYRAAGKLEEALACYRKALEIDPGFEPSRKNITDLERETGGFDAIE